MSVIGQKIYYIRKQLGWTQEELAEKMGYKHKSSINKIELGIADVTQSKIVQFADVLGTTPAFLMGWMDNDAPTTPDTLTEGELKWLALYRAVPEQSRDLLVSVFDKFSRASAANQQMALDLIQVALKK